MTRPGQPAILADTLLPDTQSRHLSRLLALNLRVRGVEDAASPRAPGWRDRPAWCVTRDGRRVAFAPPAAIDPHLRRCLERWEELAAARPTWKEAAAGAARFWLAFIAIHPFVDGNGRTAKAFLRMGLERLGYRVRGFELIDRLLLEGRPDDLDRLAALFLVSLEPMPYGGNA